MTFFICRGFAELQILKKWMWRYLLNWVEHCDEILHTHWYWQNVPNEIVKWHLRLAEFLPRFKFWKKWDYCKITFIIGRGFAEPQILKKWKWPYLLNWVEYFDRLLRKHRYYQDQAQEIVKCLFNRSRFCRAPNSEKVKMALSLELSETLWRNFAYTLVYWQDVAHEVVKWQLELVEVLPRFKFWKNWKLTLKDLGHGIAKWHLSSVETLPSAKFWKNENGSTSWTEWNILINFCVNIDFDKI